MAYYVFKIKYENTLRRVNITRQENGSGKLDITLAQLQLRIRGLFGIPTTTEFTLSYLDKEDDVVAMSHEDDLIDACLLQALNPLYLILNLSSSSKEEEKEKGGTECMSRCVLVNDVSYKNIECGKTTELSRLTFNSTKGSDAIDRDKLNACFMKDMTISDGTQLAPGTKFRKIWRFKNQGTLSLPYQTRLAHVDGFLLGSFESVNLELHEECVADEEFEVAVDFVAPMKPGRYMSHWQLLSPSGIRFGDRVWVEIEVVPLPLQALETTNSSHRDGKYEMGCAIKGEDSEGGFERKESGGGVVQQHTQAEHTVQKISGQYQDSSVTTIVQYDCDGDISESFSGELGVYDVIQNHFNYFSPVPSLDNDNSGFACMNDSKVLDVVCSTMNHPHDMPQPLSGEAPEIVKEACLEHLDLMGFNMKILNLELLQKNNNSLQQTIEDLCSITQWDSVIEALADMGFNDKELNYRLMFNNEGSIERVVRELVLMHIPAGKRVADHAI